MTNSQRVRTLKSQILSRIIGYKISVRDINSRVIFVTLMVSVLFGTIWVDGTVEEEEVRQLHNTLKRLIPSDGYLHQLTKLLRDGVRRYKIYKKPKKLSILATSLSEPERLLLISLGYQMSAADGEIHIKERKYLQTLAALLNLNPKHLDILEAGFTNTAITDRQTLEEVRHLLDPARFQSLDPIVVAAANHIQDDLPSLEKTRVERTSLNSFASYSNLKQFQEQRQQLSLQTYHIFKVLHQLKQRNILADRFLKDIEAVCKKNQSQVFRIVVIGEFSQGKSTLINALLADHIQPTRSIPCSGTISILRYGKQKRVICRYKDGKEEEISFEDYQNKASISPESALTNLRKELGSSKIKELILESPDLELCKHGVEIIDSPGLNEHPDRTAIAQKLIQQADAIVFFTHAQQTFTQEECTLIHQIKSQVTGNQSDGAVDNLFAVVNFMDLLDDEEDREEVKNRTRSFLHGENILTHADRIHYLSAKAALKGMLDGREDSYFQDFQNFTRVLEKFLAVDRGFLQMQQFSIGIRRLLQETIRELTQYQEFLTGKLRSETEKQQLIEHIGELSGRSLKIQQFGDRLRKELFEKLEFYFKSWHEGLAKRLTKKAESWSSEHSAWLSREKLVQDYTNQFTQHLAADFNHWVENELTDKMLNPKMDALEKLIEQEFKVLHEQLNGCPNCQTVNWVFWDSTQSINLELLGNGTQSELGAKLFTTGLAFDPILDPLKMLLDVETAGDGLRNLLNGDEAMKEKVLTDGLKQFETSLESVREKLIQKVNAAFDRQMQPFETSIEKAIALYENRLEQQEHIDGETPKQHQMEKIWLDGQCQQLKQVQQDIDTILNQGGVR